MKIPQLKKKPELKSCHNVTWEDDYSWVHQKNILEVLRDSSKLLPEIREYLEQENNYTEYNLKDTKKFQKQIFEGSTKFLMHSALCKDEAPPALRRRAFPIQPMHIVVPL